MAKIPNARNYRARINRGRQGSTKRSQGRPAMGSVQAGRGWRAAVLLAGTVVLFLFGGAKVALIGGLILAALLFLP